MSANEHHQRPVQAQQQQQVVQRNVQGREGSNILFLLHLLVGLLSLRLPLFV